MYTGYLAPVSNRADWSEAIVLVDSETKDVIDISACRITMSVADEDGCVRLKASTDAGTITLPDVGTFQFNFTALQMSGLRPGAYGVGVRISQNAITAQLFIGNVNVSEGIDVQ